MNNTLDTIVQARSNDVPVEVVAIPSMSYGLDKMIATKGIKGPQDYKGKKYGADLGFLNHMWMLLTLRRAGLSYDDAEIVVMLPQQSAAAFVAGSLDIDVNYLPFAVQSLQRKGSHILKSSLTDRTWERGLISESISCNSDWLDNNPQTATELLRAWFEAVNWWKENPKKGNKLVADGLGWDEGDVRLNMHGAVQLNLKQNLGAFGLAQGTAFCKDTPKNLPKPPADSQGWGELFEDGKDCVNGYLHPTWELFNEVYLDVEIAGSDVPADEGLNETFVRKLRDEGYLERYDSNRWVGQLKLPEKYNKPRLWQGIHPAAGH